jgi:hypothetical protein
MRSSRFIFKGSIHDIPFFMAMRFWGGIGHGKHLEKLSLRQIKKTDGKTFSW